MLYGGPNNGQPTYRNHHQYIPQHNGIHHPQHHFQHPPKHLSSVQKQCNNPYNTEYDHTRIPQKTSSYHCRTHQDRQSYHYQQSSVDNSCNLRHPYPRQKTISNPTNSKVMEYLTYSTTSNQSLSPDVSPTYLLSNLGDVNDNRNHRSSFRPYLPQPPNSIDPYTKIAAGGKPSDPFEIVGAKIDNMHKQNKTYLADPNKYAHYYGTAQCMQLSQEYSAFMDHVMPNQNQLVLNPNLPICHEDVHDTRNWKPGNDQNILRQQRQSSTHYHPPAKNLLQTNRGQNIKHDSLQDKQHELANHHSEYLDPSVYENCESMVTKNNSYNMQKNTENTSKSYSENSTSHFNKIVHDSHNKLVQYTEHPPASYMQSINNHHCTETNCCTSTNSFRNTNQQNIQSKSHNYQVNNLPDEKIICNSNQLISKPYISKNLDRETERHVHNLGNHIQGNHNTSNANFSRNDNPRSQNRQIDQTRRYNDEPNNYFKSPHTSKQLVKQFLAVSPPPYQNSEEFKKDNSRLSLAEQTASVSSNLDHSVSTLSSLEDLENISNSSCGSYTIQSPVKVGTTIQINVDDKYQVKTGSSKFRIPGRNIQPHSRQGGFYKARLKDSSYVVHQNDIKQIKRHKMKKKLDTFADKDMVNDLKDGEKVLEHTVSLLPNNTSFLPVDKDTIIFSSRKDDESSTNKASEEASSISETQNDATENTGKTLQNMNTLDTIPETAFAHVRLPRNDGTDEFWAEIPMSKVQPLDGHFFTVMHEDKIYKIPKFSIIEIENQDEPPRTESVLKTFARVFVSNEWKILPEDRIKDSVRIPGTYVVKLKDRNIRVNKNIVEFFQKEAPKTLNCGDDHTWKTNTCNTSTSAISTKVDVRDYSVFIGGKFLRLSRSGVKPINSKPGFYKVFCNNTKHIVHMNLVLPIVWNADRREEVVIAPTNFRVLSDQGECILPAENVRPDPRLSNVFIVKFTDTTTQRVKSSLMFPMWLNSETMSITEQTDDDPNTNTVNEISDDVFDFDNKKLSRSSSFTKTPSCKSKTSYLYKVFKDGKYFELDSSNVQEATSHVGFYRVYLQGSWIYHPAYCFSRIRKPRNKLLQKSASCDTLTSSWVESLRRNDHLNRVNIKPRWKNSFYENSFITKGGRLNEIRKVTMNINTDVSNNGHYEEAIDKDNRNS